MKTIQKDMSPERLAEYRRKCEEALSQGLIVPLPTRGEALALKGIPCIRTVRVPS
jgi:hypothetical protein